jgi:hypothetical protein
MSRITAILVVLLCAAAWAVPTYAVKAGGTLAIQLKVDKGGPAGRKPAPVRIKLLLVVKIVNGRTVARTERYVLSGHIFRYALAPGRYSVSATEMPPVVNPTGRPCKSTLPVVRVRATNELKTSVRCTLVG